MHDQHWPLQGCRQDVGPVRGAIAYPSLDRTSHKDGPGLQRREKEERVLLVGNKTLQFMNARICDLIAFMS